MKTFPAFTFLFLALGGASAALAAPLYNIVPLGFDDIEHTRDDGYRSSEVLQLNDLGQAFGHSARYNGGGTDLGHSAWLYNGEPIINVGLTGIEYTRNDGYKLNRINRFNNAGQLLGIAARFIGGSPRGQHTWLYDGTTTVVVGLMGAEHTDIYGAQQVRAFELNQAGQVAGTSSRYSPVLGQSAWLYDGATTLELGLNGPEYTSSSGRKHSTVDELNESGQVTGESERYDGTFDVSNTAWLYDGTTTIAIGLTGGQHTHTYGYKYSEVDELNEAGQVSGRSYRQPFSYGQSAWIYDGATTIDIGLTGSEHTRNDGIKHSYAERMNEAGQVTGYSVRFDGGSADFGRSTWLYDGATTIDIGLTGPEHTRNDGYKYSSLEQFSGQLSESGQVLGHSRRYNGGSAQLGTTAWLYDGATTVDIGLTDSEHTSSDGAKVSFASRRNKAGHVFGYANRYNGGSTRLGFSAWLYDGAGTINIGLTGTEHTRSDGYKSSFAYELNEAGHVHGFSERFNGGSLLMGQSAWLYDGATTTDVGLVGSEHTRNDGYKYTFVDPLSDQLNEAGQVIGASYRYNGGSTQLGQDAWFYDPVLDQTFMLQLSTRSDGYASSSAEYLGENGLVLGYYTLFDTLDNNLGDRAFYFTIADGLHDLGSLVDGGLTANGWDYLAGAIRAGGLGQILGHGKLTSQSGSAMAYLLTPVPEPSALLLAALGAVGLLARRRMWHRT